MSVLDFLNNKPIDEAVNEWIIEKDIEGKSKKTLRFYRDNIKGFIAYINPETITKDIQPAQVKDYLQTCRLTGTSPHSLHAIHRTLTVFFNWCKRQNYCLESPVKVLPPKVPTNVVKVLSDTDFLAIIKACKDSGKMAKRDRAILLIFWDTGMRLSELANIKLVDIDWHGRYIEVLGKGQKKRVVRVSQKVIKAIWDYIKMRERTNSAVWLTEEGTPLTASGVQQIIKRISKRALGRTIGPHLFRHTFASNFLMNGGDSLDLKYILGHSSLRMVMHYSEATKQRRALAAQERFSPVDRLGLR